MAGELFKAMAGVDIVHVPYKGSSGARTDVLGGQVQMMFDAVPTMSEHAKRGRVKALGTTGKARSPVLPNVPTISEAGVTGYEAVIWLGLMAPKGTPRAIVNRLNAEIAKIQNRPEVRQEWASQGALPMAMTPDEFGRYLDDDIVKWERIVKISGRRPTSDGGAARGHRARRHLRRAAQGIVGAVAEEFRLATGAIVRGTFGAVGAMREKLLQGAPCDAIILTAPLVVSLEAQGHVRLEPPLRSAACDTGIAVRGGERYPAIADGAALQRLAPRRNGHLFSRSGARHGRHPFHEQCCASSAFTRLLAERLRPFPNGASRWVRSRARRAGRIGLHADHRDQVDARCGCRRPAARRFRARDDLHGGAVHPRARASSSHENSRRCCPVPRTRAARGGSDSSDRGTLRGRCDPTDGGPPPRRSVIR